MSICEKCKHKMLPWSESLREKYHGCDMTLREGVDCSKESLMKNIQAKEIALGWVTNGQGRAFNFCVLTVDTIKCHYYSPEE